MKLLLVFIVSFMLTACATGEKISSVQLGMSKSNVISIMGSPDGAAKKENYEIVLYSNRLMSGWSNDRADYKFIFKDDSLIEYGPEKIRQDNGAAAARALTAQQSLLLWQQQQNLYNKPTITTNCTKFGATVNCNTY